VNELQGGGGGGVPAKRRSARSANPVIAAAQGVNNAANSAASSAARMTRKAEGAVSAPIQRAGQAFSNLGSQAQGAIQSAKMLAGYDPRISSGVSGMVGSQTKRRRRG